MEVQFRSVEGTVARVEDVFLADGGDGIRQRRRGDIPVLYRADMVLRHGGQLDGIGQAEYGIDLVKELGDADDLILDLILRQQDVCIVLREAAHPEHAVQRAGKLVPVDNAQFGIAQRELLIGMRLEIVDQDAARAVHRLDGEVLAVDDRRIHVVLIVIPVA